MRFIVKDWFKVSILILIISCLYWFSWKPTNIRKNCFTESKNLARTAIDAEAQLEIKGFPITKKINYEDLQESRYKNCLLENGLSF